jgi:hypothetical protein
MSRLKASVRRPDRGAVTVVVGIALVPLLLVCAVVVDGGRVFVDRQRVQTAAEAGALSGATAWARGGAACGPSVPAMVTSNAGGTATSTCSIYGATKPKKGAPPPPPGGRVDVSVKLPVATIFSRLLRRTSTTVTAQASVLLGGARAVSDLRPLSLCRGAKAVSEWINSGYTDTNVKRILIDSADGTCASTVSGNWAMLDLNGGSNSTSESREWIANGYPEEVRVPVTVAGEPGIPATSTDFGVIKGKTVVLPLYERAYIQGSISRFDVVSFAVVTIVGFNFSGSGASRYVDVKFQRAPVVGKCCISETLHYGALAPQVCSLDGKGVCP